MFYLLKYGLLSGFSFRGVALKKTCFLVDDVQVDHVCELSRVCTGEDRNRVSFGNGLPKSSGLSFEQSSPESQLQDQAQANRLATVSLPIGTNLSHPE